MTVQRDSNQLVEIKETKGEKKEKDHPMKNISYRQHLEQVTNPWHGDQITEGKRAGSGWRIGGGEQSIGWRASSRVSRLSC